MGNCGQVMNHKEEDLLITLIQTQLMDIMIGIGIYGYPI